MKARWGFLFSICEDLAKFDYRLEIKKIGAKFGNMARKRRKVQKVQWFFWEGKWAQVTII
jgi:hypothetical protein